MHHFDLKEQCGLGTAHPTFTEESWEEFVQQNKRYAPGPKKIVFVGDPVVGKATFSTNGGPVRLCGVQTRLQKRLMGQEWNDDYEATVAENTSWEDNEIWDTAGQEAFAMLRKMAYPHTDIFVICFSMENKDSLTNVSGEYGWVEEIMENPDAQKAVCLLVGTKSDMEAAVTHEDAVKVCWPSVCVLCVINMVQMAKAIGACPHVVITSSRTGAGVEVCVHTARTELVG